MKKLLFLFLLVFAPCAFAQNPPHAVDLTWNASVDTILGYNMYRSSTSGSGYIKINLAIITGLTFTDSGVKGGETWFYVARSATSSAESINSNEAKAVIPLQPPSALSVSAVR
jgi:hypothetical protein